MDGLRASPNCLNPYLQKTKKTAGFLTGGHCFKMGVESLDVG